MLATKKIAMPQHLEVIEFSEFNSPKTFRIVDEEQHLIAKVNGRPNLEACKEMVESFNQCQHIKKLCKKLIIENLKKKKMKGFFAETIKEGIKKENEDMLFTMLKEQAQTAPKGLGDAIGKNLVEIIKFL
jgi:hypothetical protein